LALNCLPHDDIGGFYVLRIFLMFPVAATVSTDNGISVVAFIYFYVVSSPGLFPHSMVNFGTSPTRHLEIYGGVLFSMVILVERRDGRRWLRNFDDLFCYI